MELLFVAQRGKFALLQIEKEKKRRRRASVAVFPRVFHKITAGMFVATCR